MSGLASSTRELARSLASAQQPPKIQSQYVELLDQLNSQCSVIRKASTRVDSDNLEVFKQPLTKTNQLCNDLSDVSRYSLDSYRALAPFLQLTEVELSRQELSYDTIKKINHARQRFDSLPNSLEYAGHAEIKAELELASQAAQKNTYGNENETNSLLRHQYNLLNHRIYYWNNFISITKLQTAIEEQLMALCLSAKNHDYPTKHCP